MGLLEILTYAGAVVFVVGFIVKIGKYATMPMHVRWELYPVPHEGKPYGGSFYEDVDHWKKERHKDHFSQYRFMIPEILFIRALYEDNRPLWYWSFPFHMGLYLSIGGLVFLFISAFLQIGGATEKSALFFLMQALTTLLAFIGFILGTIGAAGLIVKRLTDPVLKDYYSAGIDFMNLFWLGAIFVTGFLVWLSDPGFSVARSFLVGLITFSPRVESLPGLHVLNLLLFIGFWAYFPFTHMTHMVSKYFMWDKVKWDDDPNRGNPAMDEKIKTYLGYPVTWAAPHIDAKGGKKTWADVATSNPFAQQSK